MPRESIDEDPLESDQDSHDEPGTRECASCGTEISEDAQVCPICGEWLVSAGEDARWRRWLVVAVVIVIAIATLLLR